MMGYAATYSLLTFLSGVLLLLCWLFGTSSNPRSGAILRKSLLLFVLPIAVVPGGLLLKLPLGIFLLVAWEEGLKAFASSREQNHLDKFWLVTLFGIWELTIDKPWWGFLIKWSSDEWNLSAVGGQLYVTALPVLLHATTAGIYAFIFDRKPWAAFTLSWAVHSAFNVAVGWVDSWTAVIIETVVLAALLLFVFHVRPKPSIPTMA